ncbi:MAG: hypothetical protein KatS3mg085_468 [Candidatus Dojkabacteria bacterium]|nr:MAG: hypothetical protein KatS3mg085_468 [Candidatus Dojkabacteria bacterium]
MPVKTFKIVSDTTFFEDEPVVLVKTSKINFDKSSEDEPELILSFYFIIL